MANPKNFISKIVGMCFFLILISTKNIAAEEIRCCDVGVVAIVILVVVDNLRYFADDSITSIKDLAGFMI